MGTQDTTAIHIGLHEVAGLRWPKEPLSGDGPREQVAVPLPRLPWAKTAIEVPLGASAAAGIARVLTLRKIFGYGVAPTVIAIFLFADALLIWGHFGSLRPTGPVFVILALIGVLLILGGLIPDAVARATGTPYVARGRLRFPAARTEVVRQLAKLNPKVEITGLPAGDLPSRR
ncbi:hypothetical protein ACWKSP_09360 [Micromonosporaceae bacterium Da 78-11]